MYEKVNPLHPDKVADRIAGAIVDLAYKRKDNPTIAVEVLLGHGLCTVIIESSETFILDDIKPIVNRINGEIEVKLICVKQDEHLFDNQQGELRCGDNGIFKGTVVTDEQLKLASISKQIYDIYKSDGKYIINGKDLIICQSNAKNEELRKAFPSATINPLGEWSGGVNVDCGATNRKLGSDMGDSVTGGGLHGKDLSKADVSVNIYAFLKAQEEKKPIELYCAIGDDMIDGKAYNEIVEIARSYIKKLGGFEKFAEWGLIR